MKLGELEWQRAEAQGKEEDERRFLEDSRPLLAEGLVTAQEIRQQEGKVAQAAAKTRQLEEQIRLSREVLQPLSLEQAQAKLTAAEQELALARQELAACVIRAPAGGVVGYLPAYLGGEYRPARVGDALFVNLPFMVIPDMSRLVVHCFVPEAELGRLAAGGRAEIIPIAFSDLILTGKVESVGATAQAAPERPAWQKYFRVVIAVEGGDERLRSGMTVTARILSYENPAALRLPRVAIHWKDRESFVYLLRQGRTIAQPVQLGGADDRFVEIRAGLQPGDPVAVDAPP